jgi:hypothetical protein
MSDADQQGTGDNGVPVSRYDVVPSAAKNDDADLYSFRAEIPPPPVPVAPRPLIPALAVDSKLIMYVMVGGLVLLALAMIGYLVFHQDEPPAYLDLGTKDIDASGLEGRAILKWAGHALYQVQLDPEAPPQLDAFSAVAQDPPRPLSLDIRLKDSSGAVVCQKEILFPYDPSADTSQSLVPQKTADGDTVQNVANADGRVAEIVASGNMPCPAKLYRRVVAWEFASNFPLMADQEDWLKHKRTETADRERRAAEVRARALVPRINPLPAAIEGDDVIVSDNPSKGTVETRSGREFFVGKNGLRGHNPGWEVFPAVIHFRCDTKAFCVLTRPDASGALQARLVY